MSTIDIRESIEEKIDRIIFATPDEYSPGCIAMFLSLSGDNTYIDNGAQHYLWIKNKEHAQNLIKALNKAIELGWLK